MSTRSSARYTLVAVILHWVIAISIVGLIFVGWNMHENEELYQLHKSFGITVLLLTIARIIWRIMNPAPPLPAGMASWERALSHATHWGFYSLMLLMPLSGWLYVSTAYDFDVPTVLFGIVSWPDIPFVGFLTNEISNTAIENVHGALAWGAIGLISLHIAGAIKHEFGDEEGVLKRMVPGLLSEASPPETKARGALPAFGIAFAAFALIAGIPLLGSNGSGTDIVSAGNGDSLNANWVVDQTASSIRFSGMHDGSQYEGEFGNWAADIEFDPANPESGAAIVFVAMGSAQASQKLYTDSLKSAEWFNISEFPSAEARISNISVESGAYTSTVTLALKGGSFSVPFTFELTIDGDLATMTGQANFSREALDLGMTSDPGADWVDDEVTVDVTVTASRLP
ncbi:MAG: cytochrome b/b6 domain-containing protein [Pseudomonadota bacterium]